jgi:hypothetical protein
MLTVLTSGNATPLKTVHWACDGSCRVVVVVETEAPTPIPRTHRRVRVLLPADPTQPNRTGEVGRKRNEIRLRVRVRVRVRVR